MDGFFVWGLVGYDVLISFWRVCEIVRRSGDCGFGLWVWFEGRVGCVVEEEEVCDVIWWWLCEGGRVGGGGMGWWWDFDDCVGFVIKVWYMVEI